MNWRVSSGGRREGAAQVLEQGVPSAAAAGGRR